MYINLNFDANCFASFHKQCNNSNNSKEPLLKYLPVKIRTEGQ